MDSVVKWKKCTQNNCMKYGYYSKERKSGAVLKGMYYIGSFDSKSWNKKNNSVLPILFQYCPKKLGGVPAPYPPP